MALTNKVLSINPTQKLQGSIPDVAVQLGNWIVGDLNGSLVIHTVGVSGPPQMVISTSGVVATASATVSGAAPSTYVLTQTIPGSVIQLGYYFMGQSPVNSSYLWVRVGQNHKLVTPFR